MNPAANDLRRSPAPADGVVIDCDIKELIYGKFKAVRDTRIPIERGKITAFIGPSGCGKSTVLRCLNRMNDLVRGFRFEGHVRFQGKDIYHPDRSRGCAPPHRDGIPAAQSFCHEHLPQRGFRPAAQRLQGQQGRAGRAGASRPLCGTKSRTSCTTADFLFPAASSSASASPAPSPPSPQVLLMDEPCSALDPIATRKIEELMLELKESYTIAIVTHNLQQAQRVADKTGFLYVDTTQGGRTGYLVEFGDTAADIRRPQGKTYSGLHQRQIQLIASCRPRGKQGTTHERTKDSFVPGSCLLSPWPDCFRSARGNPPSKHLRAPS